MNRRFPFFVPDRHEQGVTSPIKGNPLRNLK